MYNSTGLCHQSNVKNKKNGRRSNVKKVAKYCACALDEDEQVNC